MWKQGDYINYQSGKLFIDGAVEFPKDEYDKMMEYLDDNYGEID